MKRGSSTSSDGEATAARGQHALDPKDDDDQRQRNDSDAQTPEMMAQHSLRSSHSSTPPIGTELTNKSSLRSSRSSVLPLAFEDESLRKGTTLPHILTGWGKHLKMSTNATDEDLAALAALSRDVLRLDEFISHTWSDSRTAKVIALCLYYNGSAAAILSLVASFAAFGLAATGILPTWQDQEWTHKGESFTAGVAHWSSIAGTLVFIVSLGTWHHVPRRLGGPGDRNIFFDKICIDQRDRQRQNAGIQSLSAFIACSDRIVLFWSPNYFNRLWCTFEVATLAHIHRARESGSRHGADRPEGVGTLKDTGAARLEFKPLHLAVHVLAIYGTFVASVIIFDTTCAVTEVYDVPPLLVAPILPGIIFSQPHFRFWQWYARAREALDGTLVKFEIESAGCSREEDREAIYTTVEHWFGSRRKFNWLVQNDLRKLIMKKISGEYGIPLNIAGYTMLPFTYHTLDWTVSYLQFSDTDFAVSCIIFSCSLSFLPLALIDIWVTCAYTHVALTPRASVACDFLLSVALCSPGLIFYCLYCMVNIVYVRPAGPLQQLGSFCGLLALIFTMRVLFPKLWARQVPELSGQTRRRQEWEQKVFAI